MLLSTGEQVSASKLAILLNLIGHKSISLNGYQAQIYTNNNYQNASIIKIDTERIKKELKDRVLTFKVKTGKQDQVFGTISTKQIANELEKIGYKIDKKKIVLDDAISSLGYHEVKINLHKNVIGIVTVELIK